MRRQSVNNDSADQLKLLIQNMDQWLLSEQVCHSSGAVAGVTENQKVLYWYPEIAGYYLSYLAHLASEKSVSLNRLNRLSFGVSKWLKEAWWGHKRSTRIYPDLVADWRNNWLFSFDLAMILRGIADAKACSLALAWEASEVAQTMTSFIDDNQNFNAIVGFDSQAEYVGGWSIKSGTYQWKTLSAMVRYQQQFDCSSLEQAVEVLQHSLLNEKIISTDSLPNHPNCYALEGWYDCAQLLPEIEFASRGMNSFEQMIALQTFQRNDVVAQLIRLLSHSNKLVKWQNKFYHHLRQQISVEGFVPFNTSKQKQGNVWCTIFTRQAISMLDQSSQYPLNSSLFI